jgi:CO dehydrogenase nickel-insertion accessory protein CooC1
MSKTCIATNVSGGTQAMKLKKKSTKTLTRRTRTPPVRYDDALPKFTDLVSKYLGPGALKRDCFLRDADGNITYIIRGKVTKAKRDALAKAVKAGLPAYAGELPVATASELFDDSLDDPEVGVAEYVATAKKPRFVRVVDRRIVGQDWVRGIWPPMGNVPPIIVFASHKGGVGRSTALAVSATEFARRGLSILAIDLDLEAPGLGELFIAENKQPQFGALDYFVENGHGTVDGDFLDQMRAPSTLTRGRGKVFVIPAVGQRCRQFPQNVIGKISLAYLEDASADGLNRYTLLDQMRTMIRALTAKQKYDAIFVDARAGLNETTAATVQGLGADVLFFGVDTPQTWDGYRYFLSHLARFKPAAGTDDWRFRLKMVHAKAAANDSSRAHFRDNAFELFAEHLYDEIEKDDVGKGELFGFDLDDPAAPHFGWPIFMNESYYEFDPVADPSQLLPQRYKASFGEFIELLADRLGFK